MTLRNCGLLSLALIIFGGLIYSPALNGPFVLDDMAKILENPELKSDFALHSFFDSYESHKTHSRNDPSRPFVYMCYWALWHMGGGNPAAFHAFSLALHILTSFAVGLLAWRLGLLPWVAMVGSGLFLALPLNAGTALYAFGLSDVLSAFFAVFLALWLLREKAETALSLGVAVLIFVLALASKQSAVVLPLMLIFLKPQAKKFHITLFGVALAYVILRFAAYGRIGDLEAFENYPADTYLAVQGWVFWKYVGLAVIPKGLCIDHALMPRHVSDGLRILGWGLWVLSVAAAVLGLRRPQWRLAGVAWLWWVIPLLPTGSFMPTTDLMVERRAYWPAVGLVLLAVFALERLAHRVPKAAIAVALASLLGFGAVANQRAQVYSSAESIYREVVDIYPEDLRSLGNLAVAYINSRRYLEARAVLEKVLSIVPSERNALVNLAALYQSQDSGFMDLKKAGELLSLLLSQEPDNTKALLNMGFLHLSLSQPNQAALRFAKVLELSPCTAPALYGWGKAEAMAKRVDNAKVKWEEALKCDPSFKPASDELLKFQVEH